MRIRIMTLVAAAIAFGGMAVAESVPEKFVVSGKAAEKIQDFTTINLATAERIADACEKAAGAEGVHRADGPAAQQTPYESRDRGSHVGIATDSAWPFCEFRRASHRSQQADDRSGRCGRFGAAGAGVER